MKIKKICKQCGKELEGDVYLNRKRIRSIYCSIECRKEKLSKKIICLYCKKEYWILFSQLKRNRNKEFCSTICRFNYHTKIKKINKVGFYKEVKCLNCKKLLIAMIPDLNRGRGKFCSQKCCAEYTFKKNPELKNIYKERMQKYWRDDKYLYNCFKGRLFKNISLTDLDKKIIEAKVLLFKIKRTIHDHNKEIIE